MTVWPATPVSVNTVDVISIQWGQGAAKFGDTFIPVVSGSLVDHSIQCEGTFGSGTSVTLSGSNDATSTTTGTYHALTDPYGTVINITSSALKQSTEVTSWIKPQITAGDGTEALTITVAVRRSYK